MVHLRSTLISFIAEFFFAYQFIEGWEEPEKEGAVCCPFDLSPFSLLGVQLDGGGNCWRLLMLMFCDCCETYPMFLLIWSNSAALFLFQRSTWFWIFLRRVLFFSPYVQLFSVQSLFRFTCPRPPRCSISVKSSNSISGVRPQALLFGSFRLCTVDKVVNTPCKCFFCCSFNGVWFINNEVVLYCYIFQTLVKCKCRSSPFTRSQMAGNIKKILCSYTGI